jgi:hypothetical protein
MIEKKIILKINLKNLNKEKQIILKNKKILKKQIFKK